MEGDSVHTTIERATKDSDIYSPTQWYAAVRMAKRTQPKYEVTEVGTEDVFDLKMMTGEGLAKRNMADDEKTLSWLKVKWFQYRKEEPSRIYFKYQLDDPKFSCITINRVTRWLEMQNFCVPTMNFPASQKQNTRTCLSFAEKVMFHQSSNFYETLSLTLGTDSVTPMSKKCYWHWWQAALT